ncbi:MAG: NAD(P)-binding domain-containing protein [Nannocystaceae bacterium]|nr:NAD(P)-binding domain-containing protein [Nannocystaceae bacterium]
MQSLWTDPQGPNRRHARQATIRGDQRMRAGLVWAAMLAMFVVGALALWIARDTPQRHPMGRPHVQAGLSCESCHQADTLVTARCAKCHAGHASTRPGHRALQQRGALRCIDCHRIHQDFGGVSWGPEGTTRFGVGGERLISTDPRRPELRGTVPVIPSAACARCHEPHEATDPIGRCLDGSGAMTLCFDEHQRVRGATLGTKETQDRLVLWTRAREAVAAAPTPPQRSPQDSGWLWGVVAASAFVVLVGHAFWTRPRSRIASTAAPDVRPPQRVRLPQIDAMTCLGCSACVDACPYDVLALEAYVAKVARPQDCCGLTTCEERCPNGSLVVHDGKPIDDRPAVSATLESADVPGLYLAGDLTGMPLIRNAINQGAVAVQSAVASGRKAQGDMLDLVIVGAGPAGLSAALQAKKEGLRFVLVDQGDLAQSIQSFPRGKLVFDQPLSVPLIGDLWLAESTKEELLRQWTRIVRAQALPLHTHHRVTGIGRDPGGFGVTCVRPDEGTVRFTAAQVVLAIGRRGTPRMLPGPIDPAMEDRVFYSLADARSFAQRRCVVVGLGDVAMEAALALSYAPGTTVTVVARGDDFRRGKARNIEAMRKAEATGRLEIRWQSAIESVDPQAAVVRGPQGSCRVSADAVFVLIGSIAPWEFLASAGVRRAGDRHASKKAPGADPSENSRVEPTHVGTASGRPKGIA